jgi:Tat protein secretion system quality control protein TatD with DNase activity
VVEELHSRYGDKVRAAFAVHPWYAHRRGSDWLEELEALLRRNPAAIVGEIGLDRAATTPDTGRCEHQHQLEVRACVSACVRASPHCADACVHRSSRSSFAWPGDCSARCRSTVFVLLEVKKTRS